MTRLSVVRMMLTVSYVLCSTPSNLCRLSAAEGEGSDLKQLPLSPAPAAGVVVKRNLPATIDWESREYQTSDGIPVLLTVIMDDRTDPTKRANALVKLGNLGPHLQGTNHVPALVTVYARLNKQDERRALIGCVAGSDDPRGLPLFAAVLSDAPDEIARFQAAYALARWNIRQGVCALIGLLESRTVGPQEQFLLSDNILRVLQLLNVQKGWGRPDQEILERIGESETGLTEDRKVALYVEEIKKWFEANKDRFPDWKPGDPLPVLPAPANNESGDE